MPKIQVELKWGRPILGAKLNLILGTDGRQIPDPNREYVLLPARKPGLVEAMFPGATSRPPYYSTVLGEAFYLLEVGY